MGVTEEARGKDRLAFAMLVAFAGVLYMAPGEWIPALEPFRLALTTSALASILFLVGRVGRREPITLDGLRGTTLIAFAVLTAASVGWSLYPEGSQAVAIDCLKYVAIYVTLINLVTTPRRLLWVCGAIVVASIVTSHGVIQWYLAGEDLVEGYRARWVGAYADPNRMAMSLMIVVPVAAAMFLRRQLPWLVRGLAAVAAVLAVIAIVYSHSRGGFIGLAVGTVLWTLRERKLSRIALLGVAAAALLVLAPSSFWNRTESVSEFQEDASAMGRVHAWTVASRINLDRPLLGVGAGSFRIAWPLYAPHEATRAYEAHNVFLQVLAELGVIGFVLFLLFLGSSIEAAAKVSWDPDVGWLSRALVASAAGYLVCNLSAGFLGSSYHFYVLFALLAAAQRAAVLREVTALAPAAAPPTFAAARAS